MLKKGTQLEQDKQYLEASNFYFEALNLKKTNVDATIALNRVGKKALNKYLNDFYQEEAMGNVKDAVYAYLKASEYQKKLNTYKVYHEIPSPYKDKYAVIRETYLQNLYVEGQNFMDKLDYKNAERNFTEILKFDVDYKNAKSLNDIAYVEPIFINAKQQLENEDFRNAYNHFTLVLKRIPNYKDANESRKEALERGRRTFLIFTFENITGKRHIETKISDYISSELSNLSDPFLRLVDRGNFEKIMREQELTTSGLVDESSAAEIGKLFGAQKAISGKVIAYYYKTSRSRPQKREAAEPYTVKKKREDGEGYINETKYKKVKYTNYTKTVDIRIEFKYKVISLQTSEVLLSDIIELSSGDRTSYSTYDGDFKRLYPLSQSGVDKNKYSINKLRSQFTERRKLKTEDELSNDLFKNISVKVVKNISQNLK